ncbi:MAG: hypothetical protein J0M20_15695, partial [Burkholderiales bacterium]|nr:hypothetical protein [Burkholderiales bacterium]
MADNKSQDHVPFIDRAPAMPLPPLTVRIRLAGIAAALLAAVAPARSQAPTDAGELLQRIDQ